MQDMGFGDSQMLSSCPKKSVSLICKYNNNKEVDSHHGNTRPMPPTALDASHTHPCLTEKKTEILYNQV